VLAVDASAAPASARRRPAPGRGLIPWRARRHIFAYAMMLPTFGLTALFTIYPLVNVLFHSFYSGTLFSLAHSFVGWANYVTLIQQGGIAALGTTAMYTVGFVLSATVMGILCALLLNLPLRGTEVVRTTFIIPLVVPIVATAIVWTTLFNAYFGPVDAFLSFIGLPRIDWLGNPAIALTTVVMFSTWQYVGQNVILFIAALRAIPVEVREQALVDGARGFKNFWRITLPLIKPILVVVMVIGTITAMQAFTQIYIITQGGPIDATTTAAFYVYQQAFQFFNTGASDAMASIIFVITLILTVLQTRVLSRLGGGGLG
jgi:ABC-type sugar transport system permease subunit